MDHYLGKLIESFYINESESTLYSVYLNHCNNNGTPNVDDQDYWKSVENFPVIENIVKNNKVAKELVVTVTRYLYCVQKAYENMKEPVTPSIVPPTFDEFLEVIRSQVIKSLLENKDDYLLVICTEIAMRLCSQYSTQEDGIVETQMLNSLYLFSCINKNELDQFVKSRNFMQCVNPYAFVPQELQESGDELDESLPLL